MTHAWGGLLPAAWLSACALSRPVDRPLSPPPALAPGDRARVQMLEQRTFVGLPIPQLRAATYAGVLTAYVPEDSLALRRSAWILLPGRPRAVVAHWAEIRRIDVADGHNLWGGIAGGALSAFWLTVYLSFMDALVCRPWGGTCLPGFWKTTTRFALITVPVGAVIGGGSPRWKPVYWRRRF